MKALLQRFAAWLFVTSGGTFPEPSAPRLVFEPVEFAQETCRDCLKPMAAHACPQITIDGDIAVCVRCQVILPKGTVRQHTGLWVCQPCKQLLAEGL